MFKQLIAILCMLSGLGGSVIGQADDRQQHRPNVVFILVDDLGQRDLGCYGSTFYETPHLDQLAREGVRFTAAYAACPVCSPTRASILTGKWPPRTGITDYLGAPARPELWTRNTQLLPAPFGDRLSLSEVTLAERFREEGYATFFAGKWHLGPEGNWPEDQGFDINRGGTQQGGPYGGQKYFSPYGNPRLTDGPLGEHLPDRLASETNRFMTEHQREPFFAFLSFYSVHTPLMAREDLRAKYAAKRRELELRSRWGREGERDVRLSQDHVVYAAMVEAMDQAVGKVLHKIAELGLARNTLVVFTSDNGGLSTSEGWPTSNHPWRAGKGWLYEGGLRVPLLMRWPERLSAGQTIDAPVSSPDFFPTLVAATQIESDSASSSGSPAAASGDGWNLWPHLLSNTWPERALFWHYPHYGNQGGAPGAAVRRGNWKLIHWFETQRSELYDLSVDPSEQHDLATREPQRVEELVAELRQWQESVGAQMPVANPRFDATQPNGRRADRPARDPLSGEELSATQFPSRPNILFLLADDQSYETLRAAQLTDIDTPNLDRLSARGMTFTHAYNMGSWSGAVCVASRAMLMTGQSVWRAQATAARLNDADQVGRLWPELMSQSGYATYFTGKWHVDTPPERVFGKVKHPRGGMPADLPSGYDRPSETPADTWSPSDRTLGGHWEGGRHWSEVVADDTLEFLQQARGDDRPFFIYAAFNAPHDPRQSPAEFVARYPLGRLQVPDNFLPDYPWATQIGCGPTLRDERLAPFPRTRHAVQVHRQEYYALITNLDFQIGRILDELARLGLEQNTWVFFTSDHGLAVGHHGLFGKQNMFDHSLRVPFVVAGPGVPPGSRVDDPIYLQDAMATTLELAGVERPVSCEFRSLLPRLRGSSTAVGREAIYGAYLDLQRAVIAEDWKLICYPTVPQYLLYDLSSDPQEMHNLAEEPQHQPRLRAWQEKLVQLQQELGDQTHLPALTK